MLTESEKEKAHDIVRAMAASAGIYCPAPAHVFITAARIFLAAQIATLPEDQREECLEQMFDTFPGQVDYFVKNPVGIKAMRTQ